MSYLRAAQDLRLIRQAGYASLGICVIW